MTEGSTSPAWRAAGYASAHRHNEIAPFTQALTGILTEPGPTFVEVVVEPDPPTFGAHKPQHDWTDRQFTRMGVAAAQLQRWFRSEVAQ